MRRDGDVATRRLVVSAADAVRSFLLVPGSILTVGRVADNDVIIGHDTVSRLHARVRVTDRVVIEDAASRNGIRVNGERVRSGTAVDLTPGAVVRMGPATLFLVEGSDPEGVTLWRRDSEAMRAAKPRSAAVPAKSSPDGPLVLKDERMTLLYQSAQNIASSSLSVLLLGETGVGKELLASAIHAMSPRSGRAFVTFNAAALPEMLVESELCGYERGAFTGADRRKPGLLQAADGGTIFLDEVADLSLQAQAKLLRVLETGEVVSVGALKPRVVDVRVISATNSDLYALMTTGPFRRDLYFRLSGATLHIPPLRERPADIRELVEYSPRSMRRPRTSPSRNSTASVWLRWWRTRGRQRTRAPERRRARGRAREGPPGRRRRPPSRLDRAAGASVGDGRAQPVRGRLRFGLRDDPRHRPGLRGRDARSRSSASPRGGRGRGKARRRRARPGSGDHDVAARMLGISRDTLLHRLDGQAHRRPRKGP